jgi:hypothetical protein
MSMKSSTRSSTGPPIAAGDEIEQYALAEQFVHAKEQVEAEAKDEREDYAAALDQGRALGRFPHEPRTDGETHEDRGKIAQRTQCEIQEERYPSGQGVARSAKDGKLEQKNRAGNQNGGDGALDVSPDTAARRLEMAEDGAERDADGQCPHGDRSKLALARRKLHRYSPHRKALRYCDRLTAQAARISTSVYTDKCSRKFIEWLAEISPSF